MSISGPIYLNNRPNMGYHTSLRALLNDVNFRKDLTEAIENHLTQSLPHISAAWLDYAFGRYRVASNLIGVFLDEVGRGHIFCDDLFASTFKKYIGSDIPFYCSQELPCMICYDFCLQYISKFHTLINSLHNIDKNSDEITKQALFQGQYLHVIFEQAMKQHHEVVIRELDNSQQLPYLHTKNNLHEVLARVEERAKARKPAVLPYSFEETSDDRLISDIIMQVEFMNSIRIDVCGNRQSI